MFSEEIKKELVKVLNSLNIPFKKEDILLEHPADFKNGDFSSSVALSLAKEQKTNPRNLADEIVSGWQEIGLPGFVEKIEVAGAGFINIWLNFESLSTSASSVLAQKDEYGKVDTMKRKTVLLEHTSPNTNKALHVGHVRNNITGMAISRLLSFSGAKVVKDCLFNDRGIHICKAMWGYLISNFKFLPAGRQGQISNLDWKSKLAYWFDHQDEWPTPESVGKKSDKFVEEFYGLGVKREEEEKNKKEMEEMLISWEAKDPKVRALWKKLNDWVYSGFKITFQRLGSEIDHTWYESEFYEQAKKMVDEGLQKGVFKKLEDGAILTDLSGFGLSDTIVQRADGTSMYFTQDIFLTKQKIDFLKADQYIWVVGPEQQLHLKQVFAVEEQLGVAKREQFLHLWYGYIFLKGKGRMSSRAGTVVSADDLLNEAENYALSLIKEEKADDIFSKEEKEEVAKKVGVGAVKYALLKIDRTQDIDFDWQETITLKGNSGPYLQYTYTRTQSVLAKNLSLRGDEDPSLHSGQAPQSQDCHVPPIAGLAMTPEEQTLLRTLYRFPEIVSEAARTYSPNLICNFLFDLAQKFNLFYDKERIIGSENENFRLTLTKAIGQILKNGLNLLGIETLSRM